MTAEDTINEIFDNTGKAHSVIVGEKNQQSVKHWLCDLTEDETAAYIGRFYA